MATVDRMSKHRKASRHLAPALWVGGFLLLGAVVALIALAQPADPLDRPNVVPGGLAPADFAERVSVAQVTSRDMDRLERFREQKKQARIEARKERRQEERQEARRQERQAERQEAREAEQTESVSTTTSVPTSTSTSGNRALGQEMMLARGWGMDQWPCLEQLWTHESGWRTNAYNPSGAYGIPQALPGSKMAVAGSDWQTNPATQIRWGLTYISGRYGSPCGAWGFFQANNWY